MTASIIPGTCGACSLYCDGQCQSVGSEFSGRPVWALSCLPCRTYRRSSVAATPVDPIALAAVAGRARAIGDVSHSH